ncbi:dimeric alpha-beta barrel [Fusarium longipes]|uniref:Dimeric alpha-beta barrel n=1 Tax=Fusarium longipes TaxID=694270 RepID=A0A395T8C7_9HYPO|nr:dimeric alpha-beta barrel [Fusarium longipes]
MSSRLLSSLTRAKIAPRFTITTQTLRTMASGAVSVPPGKYEFLVVVHDKPNMLEKRLEVRGQHFENMKPHVESGNWKMGGAILNSVPKDDSPSSLDFAGSTLVCIADSVEQVREQLSKDIYATSGVWDMEKVQIYPFKAAFRFN